VTGPRGAGKSTVARLLAERFDPSVLVEGDAFYGFLRRGAVAPWLPDAHSQNTVVTQAAASAAGRYAAGGFTTIYDGVVGPWFLADFTTATGLNRLEYVVLLPSVEECLARVATRQDHGFTDEAATRHMHEQFATASGTCALIHLTTPRPPLSRSSPRSPPVSSVTPPPEPWAFPPLLFGEHRNVGRLL
jgi:adenylate kinase family enzyme